MISKYNRWSAPKRHVASGEGGVPIRERRVACSTTRIRKNAGMRMTREMVLLAASALLCLCGCVDGGVAGGRRRNVEMKHGWLVVETGKKSVVSRLSTQLSARLASQHH